MKIREFQAFTHPLKSRYKDFSQADHIEAAQQHMHHATTATHETDAHRGAAKPEAVNWSAVVAAHAKRLGHEHASLAHFAAAGHENPYLAMDEARRSKSMHKERTLNKSEGSRGGHIIGHTRSGKPIYGTHHSANQSVIADAHEQNQELGVLTSSRAVRQAHLGYTNDDHLDAADHHARVAYSTPDRDVRHNSHMLAEAHAVASMSMRRPKDTDLSPGEGPGLKKAEGSRGGKIIGHTRSGKPIYAGHDASHSLYHGFTSDDHVDAHDVHNTLSNRSSFRAERHGDEGEREYLHHMSGNHFRSALTHLAAAHPSLKHLQNTLFAAPVKKSEGARGGHVIGHTKTGKPIYQGGKGASGRLMPLGTKGYSVGDHADAAAAHTSLISSGLTDTHASDARKMIAYHQKKAAQSPAPKPPAGIQTAVPNPATPTPAAAPKAAGQNPARALTSLANRLHSIKTDEAAISSGQYRKDKAALNAHALKVHDQHFKHLSQAEHIALANKAFETKTGAQRAKSVASRAAHGTMAHALLARQRDAIKPADASAVAKSTSALDLLDQNEVVVETPAETIKLVDRMVRNMRLCGLDVDVEGTSDGGYSIRRRMGGQPVEIRPDGVIRAPEALVLFALGDDQALAKAGIAVAGVPAAPKPPAPPAMPKVAAPAAPRAVPPAAPKPPGNSVLGKTTTGGTVWAHAKADSPIYRAFGPRDHAQAANLHQLSGNHVAAGEHRAMHAKMTAPKAPAMSAATLAARPKMGIGRLAMSQQKETDMVKWESQEILGEWLGKGKGEGSRGGKIIGHTRSGKPIYAADSVKYRHVGEGSPERYRRHVNAMKRGYRLFTPEDHHDAIARHAKVEEHHEAAIDKLWSEARERGWRYLNGADAHHQAAAMRSRAAITGHRAAIEDARESAHDDKLREFFGKSDHGDHERLTKMEGSRGGQVIGHTSSGKPIYASLHGNNYPKFSMGDHGDAAQAHAAASFAAHKAGDAEGAKAHGAMRFTHVQAAMRMSNAPRIVTGPNTGAPPARKPRAPRAPRVKTAPATQAEA